MYDDAAESKQSALRCREDNVALKVRGARERRPGGEAIPLPVHRFRLCRRSWLSSSIRVSFAGFVRTIRNPLILFW